MKKYIALGILTLLFVFIFTGCATYSQKEREIEVIVVACEEGTLYPDESYLTLAYAALSKSNIAAYSMYINLANENGVYDYNITIDIDGTNYVVVRSEKYEVGQTVLVTKIERYYQSELVEIEYK